MSISSITPGSSVYADEIDGLPIEDPRGWRDEYTDVVLKMFKGKDGLNDDVSIEDVKSIIVSKMIERDPKTPEYSGEKLLESKDLYERGFDAHLFHFLLKEHGENAGISYSTRLLERFTWNSRKYSSKLICAHGIVDRRTEPGTKDWHYVLELDPRFSGAKFRCITCGETNLLVTLGKMTESFKESKGGDANAHQVRVNKIAALVALPRGTKGRIYTALKTQMDSAGIQFLDDWPNGMPGEAK